ncbi:DNA repair protein-like protein Rad26 [Amylocarpus encephaloides]|uniref:DNA repair protein-like protein Rad26 n=1 Tax=Amylocarpus encephaloides TaxID=45428 RepID=A0A9P7YRL9_9HELO|nr:DNA repair protein-like protein Rad26 [Amylocarpus encephaloides]
MSPSSGDNFFSDKDLDDLPDDYLAELESNAIQFTQARTQARVPEGNLASKVAPSSDYGAAIDEEDLDDAVVIDESRSTPVVIPSFQRNIAGQATQREQFRQERYGRRETSISKPHAIHNAVLRNHIPPPPVFDNRNLPPTRNHVVQESMVAEQGSQPSFGNQDVEGLQRQIQELLKERDALKTDLHIKTGEISIVRSKQENTAKEHERQITALRKLNGEKLAKQEKALEAARIAEKNTKTDREFLQKELAEEAEKLRRLNKAKALDKQSGNVTTPKKKKTLAHRDGFDDNEIELLSPSRISPSKFQKRLGGSPSKPGGKRKRKIVESPIAPLQVREADDGTAERAEGQEMALDDTIINSLGKQDDRFNFLGTMLDHRIDFRHDRTIQELNKHTLPSTPNISFQTLLLSKIPSLGLKKSQQDLPVDFCELLISMWEQCMEEKYLAPIYLFMDLLTVALELKTSLIAPYITDSIVPLAQLTADLVIIPIYKGQSAASYQKHINVSACLNVLYLTALGCMSEQQQIMRFWKLMRFDFVLVMLSTNQPTQDLDMIMRLLSSSVFPESFGSILGETTQAIQVMDSILDRLTYILFDIPPLPQSVNKMDPNTLSKLRLEVLQLMTSMTRSPFASKAIAMHYHAIGRLVSLISDELDDLYDYKPRHEESARIIGLGTRLLYHLATRFEDDIDMQKKLSVVRGGSQKYLLMLSRLNFSEDDLVLESSIDSDVAACALEMLELAVTPEEGDAIHAAFSSGS